MMRCWCHAAMAGWLGASERTARATPSSAVLRWQHECERAGGDCAARVEAIALCMPCSRAIRRGTALKLYTRSGEIDLTDPPGQVLHYRYLGLLDPGQLHLLWRRNRDGERFVTLDDRSGDQRTFEHLAHALQTVRAPAAEPRLDTALG